MTLEELKCAICGSLTICEHQSDGTVDKPKKTIRFIEAVTTKDKALQTAIRAFSIIRFGGSLTPEEAKLFIDVCSLALPNKYRFPRHVHEAMERQVKEAMLYSPELGKALHEHSK